MRNRFTASEARLLRQYPGEFDPMMMPMDNGEDLGDFGDLNDMYSGAMQDVGDFYDSPTFAGMYDMGGEPWMNDALTAYTNGYGYDMPHPMDVAFHNQFNGGYTMDDLYSNPNLGGYPLPRLPGDTTPIVLEARRTLQTINLTRPTGRVGIRFGTTEVFFDARTLRMDPANGSDLLRDAGIRIQPTRSGDGYNFRIEFTRPGRYTVGQENAGRFQWGTATDVSGTPPLRPGTGPVRPETGRIVPPRVGSDRLTEAPGTFRDITLTEAGQRWKEGRLRWVTEHGENPDSQIRRFARIMSSLTRDELARAKGTNGEVELVEYSPPREHYLFGIKIQHEGATEEWHLAEFVSGTRTLVLVNARDPLMQIGFPKSRVLGGGSFRGAEFASLVREARSRRASEVADAGRVRSFDLPRDQKILYTGVYDERDPTERDSATHFGGLLASTGRYQIVGDGNDTFPGNNDLMGKLERRLDAAFAAGIKNHLMYFSVHGDNGSFQFILGPGRTVNIRYEELHGLLDKPKYRGGQFILRLNACNSGGINTDSVVRRIASSGDPKIMVTVGTKPDVANPIRTPEGIRHLPDGSRPTNFDTPSDYYLAKYLAEGKPYGEAIMLADQRVKELFPGLDMSTFVSMDGGYVETADTRPTPGQRGRFRLDEHERPDTSHA